MIKPILHQKKFKNTLSEQEKKLIVLKYTMLFSMFQLIVQVFSKSIIIVAKLLVMLDMDLAS